MDSTEQLIEVISKESGTPLKEVKRLIDEKKEELSGLISDEGAIFIVGRELGVSLLKEGRKNIKLKNLADGMKNVDVAARIMKVFDIREFEREGKKGKVLNVVIGDDTATVRLSLWNQEVDFFFQLGLKEEDVISVSNGWVKLDYRGGPELRVGKGKLSKSEEVIPIPSEDLKSVAQAKRMNIRDAKEGDAAELRACLVQIFRKMPFFEVCPQCRSRINQTEGSFTCKEHGKVVPEMQMVMSGVIDDGTGNLRVVFFRDLAEKLFGKDTKTLFEESKKEKDPIAIMDQFSGMGKDFIVRGRVKKNDFTGNLEMVANEIAEMDVQKEAQLILKKLESTHADQSL